jgi:DNA-binding transcriptional LysR family regulator
MLLNDMIFYTPNKKTKSRAKMKKINFSIQEARTICTIVKTLNIAETAKELEMSTNTVTVNIARVERKIGKLIFIRKQKTGEMHLAPEAIDIIPYLQTIVDAADLIESKNYTWASSPTVGKVVFTSSQTIIEYILGPYIPSFLSQHPRLNISFKQQDDLACLYPAINEISFSMSVDTGGEYKYFPFHSFTQKYWASKKYIKKFGCPSTTEELFHHCILLRKNVKDQRILFDPNPASQALTDPSLNAYEIYGTRIVDFLCEAGVGIMASSEETVLLSKLNVERILPKFKGDPIDLFLKVNKEFLKAPVAKYFIDWIFDCRDKALDSIGVKPTFKHPSLRSPRTD